MKFVLRSVTDADRDWLFKLRATTMRGYIERTWGPWDETDQHARFDASFNPAILQIVVVGGRDAGLLHLERESAELYLTNLFVHPDFQNRGLGSAVVRHVQAQARTLGVPVRLQVLKTNPAARRLYEGLGFAAFDATATYVLMRWRPG